MRLWLFLRRSWVDSSCILEVSWVMISCCKRALPSASSGLVTVAGVDLVPVVPLFPSHVMQVE